MDALYVFQHSPFGDEELRYSLRSLQKHLRGLGKVWIFGDRPAFLSDDKSIVEYVPQSAIARIGDFAMPVTNLFRQIFLSSLIPELDADIDFHPDAVDRVRSHNLPIVCGIYPQKGKRAIACHILPGTPQIVFGQGGGLVEVRYCATGFMHVRRAVYERFTMPRLTAPQEIVGQIRVRLWAMRARGELQDTRALRAAKSI